MNDLQKSDGCVVAQKLTNEPEGAGKESMERRRGDRMRAKLRDLKGKLRRCMHAPVREQGRWLGQVVRGYFAYHAVPTNSARLCAFRYQVVVLWHQTLQRRSQKWRNLWSRVVQLAAEFLPLPRIQHPWPNERFLVKHSR